MSSSANPTPPAPLVSPLQTHQRKISVAPTPIFLATLAVTPVWATTLLPLTFLYQFGKSILKPLLPEQSTFSLPDSGYVVDAGRIVPREKRTHDVVILGVTGFTGYLAAKHMAVTYGYGGEKSVKWAIAGRSQAKLDQVKQKLAQELGMDELKKIDTIVVDTSVPSSMPRLVEQTRCVATTAGPYALYGNSVVEFCAKFGTHYVDITGEIDWVKQMALKWNDAAKQTGAKIVPFCGHDSIPWDMLVWKFEEALKEKCGDTLTKVEFWDEGKGGAPGGTFATVVSSVNGRQPKSPPEEIDPFRRTLSGTRSEYVLKKNLPLWLEKAKSPWDKSSSSRWLMPFVMAPVNAEVVAWSRALGSNGSKLIEYKETMVMPDFKTAFVSYLGMGIIGSMLLNPFTLPLVQKFMLPKPGTGPSQETMDNGYLCIAGEGVGQNGNRVEAFLYFPKDGGCTETSRMMMEAALSLALQEDELPNKKGGFFSPATALGNPLMKRLVDTGTIYEERIVPKAQS